jgi:delta1-piperideine-2-carboxylate reductase
VPENWGLDAAGRPSKDPAAILEGGRVLPFGDHKGIGLALFIELLTSALSGGILSHEMIQQDATGLDSGSSKLFLAINISAFTDPELFCQRVEDLARWLHATEPGLEITLPGERGWRTREEYLTEGIPIHAEIVGQLEAAGVSLK